MRKLVVVLALTLPGCATPSNAPAWQASGAPQLSPAQTLVVQIRRKDPDGTLPTRRPSYSDGTFCQIPTTSAATWRQTAFFRSAKA